MAETSEIKPQALAMPSLKPLIRRLRLWWYRLAEEHYLM